MVLFLDDDPARIAAFRTLYGGVPVVTQTARATILALQQVQFKTIFLDHDLERKIYVPSENQNCGMEVVRWLCQYPASDLGDPEIVVHSFNGPAALAMLTTLSQAGYRAHRISFGSNVFQSAVQGLP